MNNWTRPNLSQEADEAGWHERHLEIDGGVIKVFGYEGHYRMVFQSPKERLAFGSLKSSDIEDAQTEALEWYKNPPKFMTFPFKEQQ